MKITIWDLDYFDAATRSCSSSSTYFNSTAMKISGYHKQAGDQVNMVMRDDDVSRPYDIYYLVKENKKSANPPKEFFINPKVRRVGAAWSGFKEWDLPDEMLGARPDYLLYPHYADMKHPYAQIQLFNKSAKLLPTIQNWTNTMEDAVLVIDKTMWCADKNNIIDALKFLQGIKKVSFFEPIWLKKVIYDKEITDEFLKLNLFTPHKITFSAIDLDDFAAARNFLVQLYEHHPKIFKKVEVHIDWCKHAAVHWFGQPMALQDWCALRDMIMVAKNDGIKLVIDPLPERTMSPYFHLFEELSRWTSKNNKLAWIEYLVQTYCRTWDDLYNPAAWSEVFRDLLRQTWLDHKFLLYKYENKYVSENDRPWALLEKEFKYGI